MKRLTVRVGGIVIPYGEPEDINNKLCLYEDLFEKLEEIESKNKDFPPFSEIFTNWVENRFNSIN